MKNLINKFLYYFGIEIRRVRIQSVLKNISEISPELLEKLSISQISKLLAGISDFKDKIILISLYELERKTGIFLLKNKSALPDLLSKYNLYSKEFIESVLNFSFAPTNFSNVKEKKIHYGCGGNLFKSDWLNVDFFQGNQKNYGRVNLVEAQPFQDNIFQFAFTEDFLEHLSQEDSIVFLSEAFRVLQPSGVLRLSFPGLEGVLNKHYKNTPLSSYDTKLEAYLYWDHLHFYSREELTLVAKHIGFSKVDFVEFGKSNYPELSNLDTRTDQVGLNTYVELTK